MRSVESIENAVGAPARSPSPLTPKRRKHDGFRYGAKQAVAEALVRLACVVSAWSASLEHLLPGREEPPEGPQVAARVSSTW